MIIIHINPLTITKILLVANVTPLVCFALGNTREEAKVSLLIGILLAFIPHPFFRKDPK